MQDILLEDREEDAIETPATCNDDTLPINGIFASGAIFSIVSGYLCHEEFTSNHQAL